MKLYEEPDFELVRFASDIITDSNMTGGGGAGATDCDADTGLDSDGNPCFVFPD